MANKRVSELSQITAAELSTSDLFLVADLYPNPESKKLTVADLTTYLLSGGNLSGSFYGTASWSETSSYALNAPIQSSASYATTAGTAANSTSASYAAYASTATSASYSTNAATASIALVTSATTASYATQSTFANTASFLLYTGTPNGTASYAAKALTASYVISGSGGSSVSSSYATTAGNSLSSSYLKYSGIPNGTASVALVAGSATSATTAVSSSFASYAQTASFGITTNIQSSASWASQSISASYSSIANLANTAYSASYVTPNLNAQTFGVYAAITQSNDKGQIDSVTLTSNYSISSSFSAKGTLILPYTSSTPVSESVSLVLLDRTVGTSYVLDLAPVYYFVGTNESFTGTISGSFNGSVVGTMQGTINGSLSGSVLGSITGSVSGSISGSSIGTGSLDGSVTASLDGSVTGSISGVTTGSVSGSMTGTMNGIMTGTITSAVSGTLYLPFDLIGEYVGGQNDYSLYVTASSKNILISPNRSVKFAIDINYGNIAVSTGDPLQLTTDNTSDIMTFSASGAGPYTGTAAQIITTGSTNIGFLDISGLTSNIHYIWTLSNLTYLRSNGNTNTTNIGGIPSSTVSMSLTYGAINQLYTMANTSLSYLDLTSNALTSIPTLPATMSYINLSTNPLTTLPTTFPYGTKILYVNNTSITSAPDSLPDQIVSMSFSANSLLNLWVTTLPSSLTSFDISYCPLLTSLPTIPANVLFLNASNCNLTNTSEDNICANLVSNGLNSGSLNLLNNASLLAATLTKIATLQSRGWTVTY